MRYESMENGVVIAIPFELQTQQKLPIWMWNECFVILIICWAKTEYEFLAFSFSQFWYEILVAECAYQMWLTKGNALLSTIFRRQIRLKFVFNVHFQFEIERNRVKIEYV